MPFTEDQLLLSADKVTQLTSALATPGVADPLQLLCDEAAAEVARKTAGYLLDENSTNSLIRALALYRAYAKAGPVPPDVEKDYDAASTELDAIASGKRPNLPKVPDPDLVSRAGAIGSGSRKIHGRMGGRDCW